MIGNNWYNHIHAMGARGGSPLRFFTSTIPTFEKSNDEIYKREKMDKAQAICRKLDTIKSNHMLKLNAAVLEALNGTLPKCAEIKIKSYKDYPLASPCIFGRSGLFKDFQENNKDLLKKYDEVFANLLEIDAAKQKILKAEKKEQMSTFENELMTNLDVSRYFEHDAGLNSPIRVTQTVKDMSNDIAQKFRGIPNIINMLA